MTTLALADVCDIDCVVSWSPLVLDMPATDRYARGGDAILRRILYQWVRVGGLLELPGRTLDRGELALLRSKFAGLAEAEDYVSSAVVVLTLDETTTVMAIAGAIKLVDGRTYPLEVSTADADAAITALGSTTA